MDTDPIDTTPILAQPREFAQRLARVERERAELIETVARLRAERDDAQAVARAYILRAEAAENKMLREMVDVDVVIAAMAERDAARAEVARVTELAITERDSGAAEIARLTAALTEYGWHLDNCPAADCSTTKCECGYAALRGQPAPAQTEPAGLYGKYRISKADGTPTDPNAQYFVLRIDTDSDARYALNMYADAVCGKNPELAAHLINWIGQYERVAPAGGEARE